MFKPDLIGLASVKRACVSSGVAKLSVELSLSTKTTLFFNWQNFYSLIQPHLYMHYLKVLRFIYKMKWQPYWAKILFCASVKIWNVAHLISIQLFLINLKGTYNGII